MLLAIDIGNTNTVFALFKSDKMAGAWRCVTSVSKTADEYAAFFLGLSNINGYKGEITDVIISSVVPETHIHIRQFCKSYLKNTPIFVTKDILNVQVDLERPDEIGADRLVNTVAVIEHYQSPAIVIDFGTATTFDVIGEGGHYKGGSIAPGINLSVSALAQAASKLPKISIKKPERIIGTDTVSAMQSGIYWGYVGLIEGILERTIKEMDEKDNVLVLATGGLAGTFKDDVRLINKVDNDLTLKGLFAIFKTLKTLKG